MVADTRVKALAGRRKGWKSVGLVSEEVVASQRLEVVLEANEISVSNL